MISISFKWVSFYARLCIDDSNFKDEKRWIPQYYPPGALLFSWHWVYGIFLETIQPFRITSASRTSRTNSRIIEIESYHLGLQMLGVSWSGNSGFCSVCIFDKPRTVWQEEFEDIGVLSTSICQCCYPLKMCEIQYNEADSQGKRPDIFRSRTSSLKRSIVDRSPSQTHKPYVVISVRTFERFRFGHPFAYRFSPTSLTFDFFQLILYSHGRNLPCELPAFRACFAIYCSSAFLLPFPLTSALKPQPMKIDERIVHIFNGFRYYWLPSFHCFRQ